MWFQVFLINYRSSVVSDEIAMAFIRSGATRAVELMYPRLLAGSGKSAFFTNSSLTKLQMRYLALIFCLILSFLKNRQLRVVLDGKSSQKFPVNSFSVNPTKWSNALKQFACLSVFDHFVKLALKVLMP